MENLRNMVRRLPDAVGVTPSEVNQQPFTCQPAELMHRRPVAVSCLRASVQTLPCEQRTPRSPLIKSGRGAPAECSCPTSGNKGGSWEDRA